MGYLKDKAVVLVTHQLARLSEATRVLALESTGYPAFYGPPHELHNIPQFKPMLAAAEEGQEQGQAQKMKSRKAAGGVGRSGGNLIVKEEKVSGLQASRVFCGYLR